MVQRISRDAQPEGVELSRRSLINQLAAWGLGAAAAPFYAAAVRAQAPTGQATGAEPLVMPLPLTMLLHHTGISVPDVQESALFYSKIFGGNNVQGEKEPFLRYFIQLDPGSVAIGKLGTLGSQGQTVPLIDHICVGAKPYDDAAWRARLAAEGLRYVASGVFLGIDNIPIQVAGSEGGESMSAGEVSAMPVLYTGTPLVTSHGFDHVMLRVADAARASAFWQKMFAVDERERRDGIAWLGDGSVSIGLRPLVGAEKPGIEYQAMRTEAFNHGRTGAALQALKARMLKPLPYDPSGSIRFVGVDGIETLLVQREKELRSATSALQTHAKG